jgi:hypothetical protein
MGAQRHDVYTMPLELTTTLVKHFPDAIRYEIVIRCALPLSVKRRPDDCRSPAASLPGRAISSSLQPVEEKKMKQIREDSAICPLPVFDSPLEDVWNPSHRDLTPIEIRSAHISYDYSTLNSPRSRQSSAKTEALTWDDAPLLDLGATHVNRRSELDSNSESGTPLASPAAELLTLSPVDLARHGGFLTSSSAPSKLPSSEPPSPLSSKGKHNIRSKASSSKRPSLSVVGPYRRLASNPDDELESAIRKDNPKKSGILPRLRRSRGNLIPRRTTSHSSHTSTVAPRGALSALEPNSYQQESSNTIAPREGVMSSSSRNSIQSSETVVKSSSGKMPCLLHASSKSAFVGEQENIAPLSHTTTSNGSNNGHTTIPESDHAAVQDVQPSTPKDSGHGSPPPSEHSTPSTVTKPSPFALPPAFFTNHDHSDPFIANSTTLSTSTSAAPTVSAHAQRVLFPSQLTTSTALPQVTSAAAADRWQNEIRANYAQFEKEKIASSSPDVDSGRTFSGLDSFSFGSMADWKD